MQIGAQLYTLRAYCQNERDLGRSLERVAGMGYGCVQLSAIGPIAPGRVKALCDENGLKIVLTHNPESDFLQNTDAMIERHQLYGCGYVGLGYLPDRYHAPDFLPYFAEDYGPAAEKLRAAGMKMMYHNHAFEFERMPDGRPMMEHLLEMLPADLMGVTADTYWLQYAGVDVREWLKAHAERLHCVHLKDYAVRGFDIRMAAVGQGNLNFSAIMGDLEKNGVTEYALVEQDECYGQSPFDCLRRSVEYLKAL
ncbi:MAG: sugar phosphate isomerase/epimerase [Clostridia bacterium]|nr:sugar phosphate isomerase/epimerase [Clostridia bacterium]